MCISALRKPKFAKMTTNLLLPRRTSDFIPTKRTLCRNYLSIEILCHSHTLPNKSSRTDTHTNTHTYIHTNTNTHTHGQMHRQTQTETYRRRRTNPRRQGHSHAHTNIDTQRHTESHKNHDPHGACFNCFVNICLCVAWFLRLY